MPKLAVTAAFENANIAAVNVIQVRRKDVSAKKYTHPLSTVAAKLKDPTKPPGSTNPWVTPQFQVKGVGNGKKLILRVVALDKNGDYLASVGVPYRKKKWP